jgi:acetyl-CoA acyltransferase
VPNLDPKEVDDLILGCAMPEGEQGLNIARVVGLLGGLSVESSAMTINRFCSSGLQAIAQAAERVAFGSVDVVVAGGVESMSMVPMTGNKISVSAEVMDRFPTAYTPMGLTAENVAARFEISRAVARRVRRALATTRPRRRRPRGASTTRSPPVRGHPLRRRQARRRDLSRDEFVRADTTAEKLGRSSPRSRQGGHGDPGQRSPLSDGAAAAVVMSKADRRSPRDQAPRVLPRVPGGRAWRRTSWASAPSPRCASCSRRPGSRSTDIDLIEMNEAFAAQAVYCQRELGIADEKLNVNGGAIALGHPSGAPARSSPRRSSTSCAAAAGATAS